MNHSVYLHKRSSDGQVFYVGIGKRNRHMDFKSRNPAWKRYTAKYGLPIVSVIAKGLSEQQAKDLEVKLIAIYKRRKDGGTLTNITAGGDSNPMHTDSTRKKMSMLMKGRKFSKETLEKMSMAKKGKPMPEAARRAAVGPKPNHHMKLEKYREMTSLRFSGCRRSVEHRKKNSEVHSKAVIATKNGAFIARFSSQRQAAKWAGCTAALIGMCVSGKVKTAKGFNFSRVR